MRYTSKRAVEYDLEQHYILRKRYLSRIEELSDYRGVYIKASIKNRRRLFYTIKRPGEDHYTYASDGENSEIQDVKEYRFYKEMLAVIDSNIRVMEDFLGVYKITRAENINELLPRTYQLSRDAAVLKLEPAIGKWMQEMREIKSKYPVLNPAGLTCTAFDGTKMRSRAECIHYEAFYIYDVPCIFELPYELGHEILSPDFTALDVFEMKPKIFEHLGNWFHRDLVKRRQYRTESVDRWDQFAQIGFYPELNLLLTFGARDSGFDAQATHRKIAMLSVPPPSEHTINMLRRL